MASHQLVARNVRRLRIAQGLSQEALAFKAGLPTTYISRIENRANVTLTTIDAVAKGLGVKTVVLFDAEVLGRAPQKGLRAGRKPSKG